MSVKNLLKEEFENELKGLSKIQLGTEEYKATVGGVTQIADRIIRIEELENDKEDKNRTREMEENLKLRQFNSDQKNQRIKDSIAIGTTLLSTAVLVWGTVGTWKFDAEHSSTSTLGRTWLNNLLPKCLRS